MKRLLDCSCPREVTLDVLVIVSDLSRTDKVKKPQRDLPLGIGIALSICYILCMLVSIVIVGLVPYNLLDPDTPISSAFATYGMQWAAYIVTSGAVTALCATLMGSILPQPRILMAMSRDGLLPSFVSDINERTQVPVKSTILTGMVAAILAFFMEVSQLAGMVSVGTLLAFTTVAISVLILRYVPPDVVPLPSSLQPSIDSVSTRLGGDSKEIESDSRHLLEKVDTLVEYPLIEKEMTRGEKNELRRRKLAAWAITLVCTGVLISTSAASAEQFPSIPRYTLGGMGGFLLLSGLLMLACIDQDNARHSFGFTGGFLCPFVPFVPVFCILVNTYLLINLGASTWIKVSGWMAAGALIYVFYGRTHSSLSNAVYVSTAYADEIYRTSSDHIE